MSNAPDFKIDGLWARTVYLGNRKSIMTHAYRTYKNMVDRTRTGSKTQAKNPTYRDCQNGFGGFQAFADWATKQVGYGTPGFQLDKDLLVPGNKVYSVETCCFLPAQINMALQRDKLDKKSEYPVGISRNGKNGLKARIKMDGKQVFLASTASDTPENQAFLSTIYERAKQTYLHQLAERFKDQLDPRAYQALLRL